MGGYAPGRGGDATITVKNKATVPMKRASFYLLFSGLLAIGLAGGNTASAADTKTKSTNAVTGAAQTTKAKREGYPFYGTVAAVDQQAKTISLKKKGGQRVLKIDSKSGLEANGKPAILADVKVSTYAHGRLHKDSTGAEVIVTAKFDKEPPRKGAAGTVTPEAGDQSSTNQPAADQPAKKAKSKKSDPQPQ